MRTLASRVKYAREKLGISSNEVDRRLEKKSGYTSRIEGGQRSGPRPTNLEALAAALNVTIEWLVSGKGPGPGPKSNLPPNLSQIAPELVAKGYSDWLIRQAAVFFEDHEDLTPEQWRDYLEGLRREARRMELEAAAALAPRPALKSKG